MANQRRFLISYICDNQPNTIEISSDAESLSTEDAEKYIKLANKSKTSSITDIRVTGLYTTKNPKVHPGHYQQPEG